jgi:hypothetical protein
MSVYTSDHSHVQVAVLVAAQSPSRKVTRERQGSITRRCFGRRIESCAASCVDLAAKSQRQVIDALVGRREERAACVTPTRGEARNTQKKPNICCRAALEMFSDVQRPLKCAVMCTGAALEMCGDVGLLNFAEVGG